VADRFDVVVLGGGIGGAALATVLARAGVSVLVLEKSTVFRDHVRGEWIAPWGVAELKQLGLYDEVRAGGGHHLARHWFCDEDVPPDEAMAMAVDLTTIVPEIPGPLCIGHPALCQLFVELAAKSGATVRRGVGDATITAGTSPAVHYRLEGVEHQETARLIVGADGRGSQVRRQLGIELQSDPTHHLFAGMLIEGAHGWPSDTEAIGTEGDVHYLAFPQGGGRVRLYLGYSVKQSRRLAGVNGPRAFLDAFRLQSLPGSESLASAEPAGPCNSYPNQDSWTDQPYRAGVVLIGDAAGSNDPIIGQGLSITLRDVRLIRDVLLAEPEWTAAMFEPYARERSERMRRLRFTASLASVLNSEFDAQARARRQRARERQMQDPTLMSALLAAFLGPENAPPEAFEESTRQRLFGA